MFPKQRNAKRPRRHRHGTFEARHKLPLYLPDAKLKESFKNNFSQSSLLDANAKLDEYFRTFKIDPSNIYDTLRTLLQIEDICNLSQYPALAEKEATLIRGEQNKYSIKLNNSSPLKADNILTPYMDEVVLVPPSSTPEKPFKYPIDMLEPHSNERLKPTNTDWRRVAQVVDVIGDVVHIRLSKKEIENLGAPYVKYDLIFRPRRMPIRYQFRALELLESQFQMREFLCPKPSSGLSTHCPMFELKLLNKRIASNPEQLQAVRNIVEGSNSSVPYMIFGPPGTGKTSTLVEAILQIRLHSPASRILVTAGSNSACDTVALRICKYLLDSPDERISANNALMRVFSKSIERKGLRYLDKQLRNNSNCKGGRHEYPSVEFLQKYGIIVATLCTVGKLVTGNMGYIRHPDVPPQAFFTHVFIDEAAASTEPETLVGLMGIRHSPECRIVFCGDYKQLGPVLKSTRAIKLGLGQSLMERLAKHDCYAVDEAGNYDQTVQTRLRRNYRSHPQIVSLFNHLYYDNELIAVQTADTVRSFAEWPILANPEFPIIFQAVHGATGRSSESPSTYNELEMKVVMWYLRRLLVDGVNGRRLEQTDIGVITPYKLQCTYLQKHLSSCNWNAVEVGSVEAYQGREKEVILVSFVKSFARLGFINCPRRLNVALSRAKSLLIIIGNPVTLRHIPDMYYVIDQCEQNGTMRRRPKEVRITSNLTPVTSEEEDDEQEMLEEEEVEEVEMIEEEMEEDVFDDLEIFAGAKMHVEEFDYTHIFNVLAELLSRLHITHD